MAIRAWLTQTPCIKGIIPNAYHSSFVFSWFPPWETQIIKFKLSEEKCKKKQVFNIISDNKNCLLRNVINFRDVKGVVKWKRKLRVFFFCTLIWRLNLWKVSLSEINNDKQKERLTMGKSTLWIVDGKSAILTQHFVDCWSFIAIPRSILCNRSRLFCESIYVYRCSVHPLEFQ
jgi:hypothetical protein